MNKLSARFQSLTRSQQLFLLLYVLVTLVLWGFVWAHAFTMDITHDEAYSYRLVKTNYFIALFGSANTHWLNTFFMEIFNSLLGDAPGYLRLHSVLAFPFFSLAVYRLGKLIKVIPAQLVFYALVLFNPYVLDFFSLARGYGLAMTFQAWGIVYFVKAGQSTFRYRSWLMVFIMNALAIASNLSYFYTVIGMAGFYVSLLLVRKFSNQPGISKTANRIFLLYVLLVLVTIADLLFIKYYGKDLGFGGDTNFIGSLIGSVWEGSFYRAAYGNLLPVLTYISFFLLIIICTYYGFLLWRSKNISMGFLLCLPFTSIVVLNILFHVILKTPYLYGRTALQWYIPGLLIACFAVNEWLSFPKKFRFLARGLSAVVLVVMTAHFYYNANKHSHFEYFQNSNTRQALYDLYARQPEHPYISPSMEGIFINYYSLIKDYNPRPVVLPEFHNDSADPALRQALLTSDYIISWYPATLQCLQQMGLHYEVLSTYPPGNNKLLRIYH